MLQFLKSLSGRSVAINAFIIVGIYLISTFVNNLTHPLTDELDLAWALEATAAPFGGWLNLLILLGELALIAGGTYMLYRAFMKQNDMSAAVLYTVGVLFTIVVAAVVGLNWVVLPSGAAIVSLVVIVVIVGGALLMRSPFKTVVVANPDALEAPASLPQFSPLPFNGGARQGSHLV